MVVFHCQSSFNHIGSGLVEDFDAANLLIFRLSQVNRGIKYDSCFLCYLLLDQILSNIGIIVDGDLGALFYWIRLGPRRLEDPLGELGFSLSESFSHTVKVFLDFREMILNILI